MEEEEKLEIRQHLIKWVDTFLKDGIVPNVVNPKAIKANYILKSKVKDKIEELNKKEKEELKGMKGQDRYFVKQTYQNKRMILQELIKESEE